MADTIITPTTPSTTDPAATQSATPPTTPPGNPDPPTTPAKRTKAKAAPKEKAPALFRVVHAGISGGFYKGDEIGPDDTPDWNDAIVDRLLSLGAIEAI